MKILIVDDETAVYEHLKALIPWEELGWSIAGHALNGEEACELVRFHNPQLILTDVRMPIMDGLKFMEWLRQTGNTAEVIVLSGHGDFEYSRKAFLLGAFDYVLKPVQEAELLRVLDLVVEKLHQNSAVKTEQIRQTAVIRSGLSVLTDELFTHAVSSGEIDEHELFVRAEQLQIELPENGYYLAVLRILNQEEKVNAKYKGDRGVFHFAVRNIVRESLEHASKLIVYRQLTKSNEIILLCASRDKEDKRLPVLLVRTLQSLQKYLHVHAKLGVSLHKTKLSKLSAAYREASHALDSIPLDDKELIAYYGAGTSIKQEAGMTEPYSDIWKQIGLSVEMLLETGILRDGKLLMTKLNEAFEDKALAGIRGRELKISASVLLEKIEAKSQNEDVLLLVSEGKNRLLEMNVPQLKELLTQIFERLLSLTGNERRLKNGKTLIEVICRYIEEHYRTVTLDDISQRFYLNKNYFCTLFKQATELSFMEFVTEIRMKHAKRLLKESELKTYEIAEQVGYMDQRYFSQVFKKAVGMQPTQYKRKEQS
ncbi:response regulator [Paenibacillus harenae]|uniref:response regulator n=1 Tax=Paenibacillus harenae TaxID=306543 RepID=UPI00278DB447|nr:response regulator [Paenibacillus harenae]MDQ0060927.1 two-component system response regulator YesN [Paenibacillus harenae]